jgi:hypothetical protein
MGTTVVDSLISALLFVCLKTPLTPFLKGEMIENVKIK